MKCRATAPLRAIGECNQLLFSPPAYFKLLFFCHAASTEVGAFGISSETDPLLVEDIVLIKQRTSSVTVVFDDLAVADHFEAMADAGVVPARCGRLWIHTHPGSSACPSMQDEMTFSSSFGGCDWSVMAIVARGGESYARMQFSAGPGGQMPLQLLPLWKKLPEFFFQYQDEMPRLIAEWRENLQTLVQPEAVVFPTQRGDGHASGNPPRLVEEEDFFASALGTHLHHPDRMDLEDVEWAFLQAWEEGAYV